MNNLTFTQTISMILLKLTSGRWILTIMSGAGLLMMENAILKVLVQKAAETPGISATEILAFATTIFVVIQSVFMSYFAKRREWEDGDKDFNENQQPVIPTTKKT